MAFGRPEKILTFQEIEAVQKIAKSKKECIELLGITYPTYKKYAKMYGLFDKVKNNKGGAGIKRGRKNPFKTVKPIDLILQNKYKGLRAGDVKQKLIDSGIKEECCDVCNYNNRRALDNKVPIILTFKDKNKNNYKIENLQFVCYNCFFVHHNGWSDPRIQKNGNI